MIDAESIGQAYSAVKAIKELGETLIKGKIDAEAKEKIYDMMTKLGSVQDQLFNIRELLITQQDENQKLKTRIKEIEDSVELKSKIVYEKPSYWIKEGDQKDGPYCQRCWDADQKLVRLQEKSTGYFVCLGCDKGYEGPNYKSSGFVVERPRRKRLTDGY